jgi:hypothetical protein
MSFPGSGPDTPDAYIERNPYDEEHDPDAYEPEDEEKRNCQCCGFPEGKHHPDCKWFGFPPPKCASGCGRPALDGHMTCGLAGCNEGARRIGNQ